MLPLKVPFTLLSRNKLHLSKVRLQKLLPASEALLIFQMTAYGVLLASTVTSHRDLGSCPNHSDNKEL